MSLRAAVLALLTAAPMTGYEVSKRFRSSVGHVWHAPDSQIYPELRRLAAEGLLDVEEVPGGPRGAKRMYRVTDAGRAALQDWVNTVTVPTWSRDAEHLKAAYFDWGEPDAVRGQLEAHLEFYEERCRVLQEVRSELAERRDPTLLMRLENCDPSHWERIVACRVFAYDGLLDRARREADWAREGLARLPELTGMPAPGRTDTPSPTDSPSTTGSAAPEAGAAARADTVDD